METKQALEELWRRPCFNPLHINIVADQPLADGRRPADAVADGIWLGRGRKVSVEGNR